MSKDKYSLKYDVSWQARPKGFTREQLEADGRGGCDALVWVSILREGEHAHEGEVSMQIASVDGQNENADIPNTELFMVALAMLRHLADVTDIPMWQWRMARGFVEDWKSIVARMKKTA